LKKSAAIFDDFLPVRSATAVASKDIGKLHKGLIFREF